MNTFSDPRKIVEQLDIVSGMHIADLGAGSGSYVLALGEKLKGSPDSRVFAVDVQKELLNRIHQLAEDNHLSLIHIIWGDIEVENGSRLRHDSLDMVVIANTLFQVEKKAATIKEAHRILKPGGKLVIIDWAESFGNIGPKQSEVFSEEEAKVLSEEHGFTFDKSLDAGNHHYGFITRKF